MKKQSKTIIVNQWELSQTQFKEAITQMFLEAIESRASEINVRFTMKEPNTVWERWK